MSMFKVGDKVKVSYGFGWEGEGVITSLSNPPDKFYHVKMLEGEWEGITGGFSDESLTLTESSATIGDLRRVIDSLRDQGYDIDPVNITAPPAQFTL